MKKRIFVLLLVLVMLFCATSCDIHVDPGDLDLDKIIGGIVDDTSDKTSDNSDNNGGSSDLQDSPSTSIPDPTTPEITVNLINKSTFHESSQKYRLVDSYELGDGNYYYFYHLGTIDYIPLNLSDADGVYFGGNNLKLELKMSTIHKEQSIKDLQSAIQNSVSLTTDTYLKDSISASAFSTFEAKIEAGISNKATNSISNTFSESFSASIQNESKYEKNITYEMKPGDPVGFYFYTLVASMKVYEVVVYNPNTQTVEYMSTYNQLGAAIPGLFYSPFSFIDCSDYDITFDEHLIPSFDKPAKQVASRISVPLNANGGSCSLKTWEGQIGEVYGELPIPKRPGYVFDGWYAGGLKIEQDSPAIFSQSIDAKWILGKNAETIIKVENSDAKVTLDSLGEGHYWGVTYQDFEYYYSIGYNKIEIEYKFYTKGTASIFDGIVAVHCYIAPTDSIDDQVYYKSQSSSKNGTWVSDKTKTDLACFMNTKRVCFIAYNQNLTESFDISNVSLTIRLTCE